MTRTGQPDLVGEPRTERSAWMMRLRVHRITEAYSSNYVLLLAVVLLLVVIGLVMVLSSSAIDSYTSSDSFFTVFFKQGWFALVGVPAMLAIGHLKVKTIRRLAWPFFGLMLFAQALVLTPLGIAVNGNRNWLRTPVGSVQPSELLKVAMILWLAAVLANKSRRLTSFGQICVPALVGAFAAIGLVLLGRDLGTAMIMAAALFGCLFFARIPMRYLLLLASVAGAAVLVLALASPNRLARIVQFVGPQCSDYLSSCWQSIHGTWALANGGIFGVGLGNSVAKWSWLPAAENDFIYAIIGEELGLLGAVTVLLLFVVLAFVLGRIIVAAPDVFGRVLVGGVFIWIVGQAFVNIAVVIGLLPVLGVPLPFVSSGGSALLSALVAMGFVLAIAKSGNAAGQQQAEIAKERV